MGVLRQNPILILHNFSEKININADILCKICPKKS